MILLAVSTLLNSPLSMVIEPKLQEMPEQGIVIHK